jgi:perosamine synthetase
MSDMNIYLDAPNLTGREKEFLNQAVESGFVSTYGPFVQDFEKQFMAYIKNGEAVAVQSGTAGLHICLHELGIGPGDEVILPALTFVATINSILYAGARPVIVDVDPDTFCIDPLKINRAITSRTKAVIPVHLYGNPCDMESIMNITGEKKIYVIEDATESLGSKWNESMTGTIGDFGCFSFNGNKIMTTGGGGMVVSHDTDRLQHIRYLINQANPCEGFKAYSEVGFNYRMTNIEAALGLAQLQRLEYFLERKKEYHNIYTARLGKLSGITVQKPYKQSNSSYWLSVIVQERIGPDLLRNILAEKEIPSRRVFEPLGNFYPYKNFMAEKCEVAEMIFKKGLCLPSSTLNTYEGIDFVCSQIEELLRK